MKDKVKSSHFRFLGRALQLALIRCGATCPNPAVGAVVVRDNQILAEGYHLGPGQAHAEVMALQDLSSELLANASLYVTLEPCCHQGRTPPCTQYIINKGIRRVYFAYFDPNPLVAGQGQAALIAAGVECHHLPLLEINEFYQPYYHWQKYQRPFVILKLALTLDGKIAHSNGTPLAITGSVAKAFTHEQRRQSGAILTTSQTIIKDNPQLNVRLADTTQAKEIYVLDRQNKLSGKEQIFKTAKHVTLFYDNQLTSVLPASSPNLNYYGISSSQDRLHLDEVIQAIGAEGIHQLWVEAGGRLAQSLLEQRKVQRAYFYIAPCWQGTSSGLPAFQDQMVLSSILSEVKVSWSSLGNDGLLRLDFNH